MELPQLANTRGSRGPRTKSRAHAPRAASFAALVLFLLALAPAVARAAADITSYAIVRDDASLLVRGNTIRLAGTYIPPTGETCRTRVRPIRCASRAALALDLKIQGFVRCEVVDSNPDGSLDAFCFVRGDSVVDPEVDLGAWLISQGWAVAGPDAPFEYTVLEKIARDRDLGVWGFQVDSIRRHFRRRD